MNELYFSFHHLFIYHYSSGFVTLSAVVIRLKMTLFLQSITLNEYHAEYVAILSKNKNMNIKVFNKLTY